MRSKFSRRLFKWIVLFFLVVESLGVIESALLLVLKIAYGYKAYGESWGQITLELALRIAIVVFLLLAYLCLRKVSRLPLGLTRQSALLTTRAVQSLLIASIPLYVLAAEGQAGLQNGALFLPAWVGLAAVGTVMVGIILRKRFLRAANEELLLNPYDARVLSQWRKITILSMVLALSIGVDGLFLRLMGTAPLFEWLFLFSSVGLLFLWGPHLSEVTSSPGGPISPPDEGKS